MKEQGFLPFGGAPIHYRTSKGLADPVAKLQQRLDSGETALHHEAGNGYLRSVLKALRIPVSSQTLVFSKTSFQYPYINPQSPRALYFNDDVYVGQVHGSKALEFVSFDPMQGAIFYILSEQKVERPRFERSQLDCVQCHVHASTRAVPGVMVRSVVTNPTGYPKAGARVFTTGHESPLAERWEGWYVTGGPESKIPVGQVDLSRYLTPTSDVVAHLVLAHQTQMHNYITETNYRFRLGQSIDAPVEGLVRYLLFANEAPLMLPAAAKDSVP